MARLPAAAGSHRQRRRAVWMTDLSPLRFIKLNFKGERRRHPARAARSARRLPRSAYLRWTRPGTPTAATTSMAARRSSCRSRRRPGAAHQGAVGGSADRTRARPTRASCRLHENSGALSARRERRRGGSAVSAVYSWSRRHSPGNWRGMAAVALAAALWDVMAVVMATATPEQARLP